MNLQPGLVKLPIPNISTEDNQSNSTTKISLSSPIKEATIFYTLDGTAPTSESTLYDGHFNIDQSSNIKAFATMDGYIASEVLSATIQKRELLFRSDTFRRNTPPEEIEINIKKYEMIYLVVEDGNDGTNEDHADWADAKFITADDNVIYLSEIEPANWIQGWGDLGKDRSVGGRELNINGINFKKGLGTHSVSEIIYTIPSDVKRFECSLGLDNESTEVGSVSYKVFAK